MGGMGFISANHATILLQQLADQPAHASRRRGQHGVKRYLYSSSACVYPEYLQTDADVTPLREEDAYPAQPQDAYGWEKLFDRAAVPVLHRRVRDRDPHRPLPQHLRAERHLRRRAREGAGGDLPRRSREVEAGGIDRDLGRRRADALVLLHRRLRRGHLPADDVRLSRPAQPRHGSDGQHQRAGADHHRDLGQDRDHPQPHRGPQGVRGRNSDNTRLREVLGWEPKIDLEEGLRPTYRWIEEQVRARSVAVG